MKLLGTRTLPGPNVWATCPVFEVSLDLAEVDGASPQSVDEIHRRLDEWMAALDAGLDPGVDGASGGMRVARDLASVAVRLQNAVGVPSSFSGIAPTADPGVFKLGFEYVEEELAQMCVESAREICIAAEADLPVDLAAILDRVRAAANRCMIGPSTNSIVQAARRRNIPCMRLDENSLVQLGYGKAQRRICAAESDRTLAVAEGIAQDKEATRILLRAVGVPVPRGFTVANPEEAWEKALEIGLPVVVKPRFGNQGRGVTTNLATREEVNAAFEAAGKKDSELVVEKHISGQDYRLLVVDGRVVAASRREPAQVIGDGKNTVRALIELENRDPRRGDDHSRVLSKLVLDEIALQVLAHQGRTPDCVPEKGELVLIRRNANLSTGGTAEDVTDSVCPEVAQHAVAAASMVGLDVAGVDIVADDISIPLEKQDGVVVEVNAAPGLRMHLAPSQGLPRDVGAAIVNMLFPEGETGRIPIAAISGTNGKTTVTRFLARILKCAGKFVGMTCTDGIYLDERRIDPDDCSGPASARLVLRNRSVEAAVFETARGGILRRGLGFDQCLVAVVTNIADGDHLGMNGVETPADLAHVKGTIVRSVSPDGAAVLNAADPLVVAMAASCPGRVIYFARDGANPVIVEHRAMGGTALFVSGGDIVLAQGEREEPLLGLECVPITFGGHVGFETENALAALAAAWVLGVDRDTLRQCASSFSTSFDDVPGRMNVFSLRGGTVILDYGHNAPALQAMIEALDAFPHSRRCAVYSMAGDRRDTDLIRIGELLGDAFDKVILYEPYTIRGRRLGEISALIRQGLAGRSRTCRIVDMPDPLTALVSGLDGVTAGDLLVLQHDELDEALDQVRAYLGQAAEPVCEAAPLAMGAAAR